MTKNKIMCSSVIGAALVTMFLLTGCFSNDRTDEFIFYDDFMLALENGYPEFNKIVAEHNKGTLTEDVYGQLKDQDGSSLSFKSFQLVTFESGEKVLIQLVRDEESGRYLIFDIIFVPDEMSGLFD